MKEPNPDIILMYEAARRYEEENDLYHAIKLYKRILKEGISWADPYLRLGHIYKYRQEWKPALYYNKKAIALSVKEREAWWNVGIAATALNKRRLAQSIWTKFGLSPKEYKGPVSTRRQFNNGYEIMWAQRICPARAVIKNIPHPGSDRKYNDIVLLDQNIQGHHRAGYLRLPIYDELGVYKTSNYSTFSCLLHDATKEDVMNLHKLCLSAGLGFEVWANAARAYTPSTMTEQPEYYAFDLPSQAELLVAIAAKLKKHVLETLNNWKLISLKSYSEFQSY